MTLEITSRHFSPSSKLKELIRKKVSRIDRFNNQVTNCHVILTKANESENAEIKTRVKGKEFIGTDNAKFFEKSVTGAVDKVIIQLKKHRDKTFGKVKKHFNTNFQ